MKKSCALPFVWTACLLATAGDARGEPVGWSYTTDVSNGIPLTISNFGGGDFISLQGIGAQTPGTLTIPVVTTVPSVGMGPEGGWSATAAPPDTAFSVAVHLTDAASGRSGTLSFPGYVLGSIAGITPDTVGMAEGFSPVLTDVQLRYLLYNDQDAAGHWQTLSDPARGESWVSRSLLLGGNVYTVTLGKHPADWGIHPGDDLSLPSAEGTILADLAVRHVSPEPSSLMLSLLGVCCAGAAIWRRVARTVSCR